MLENSILLSRKKLTTLAKRRLPTFCSFRNVFWTKGFRIIPENIWLRLPPPTSSRILQRLFTRESIQRSKNLFKQNPNDSSTGLLNYSLDLKRISEHFRFVISRRYSISEMVKVWLERLKHRRKRLREEFQTRGNGGDLTVLLPQIKKESAKVSFWADKYFFLIQSFASTAFAEE